MNAVIYARYSSHAQNEQSIEGQLRDDRAWAEQNGYQIVAEYIDRALTGTKDARPDFLRMIDDASKRQFSVVIVWKLDRFARNRYDSAIYKARLKKYGVRVVSVKENITDNPEGIILEGLLESMAEYYSANLSQNIRRGQRESVANGTFLGGPIPFGYKSVDRKLIPDEKLAPHVRFMFERYADGVPKKDIIDELTRRGVTGRAGKPLSYDGFTHILRNPVYIGQYTYSGQVIPDLARRIISDELFARVSERLRLNARTGAKAKARVEYALTGKAFCGLCGAPMAGESGKSRNGDRYYYYACHNRKKYHTCEKKNERKDFIEWYVVEQTLAYILRPDRAALVARAVVAEYDKDFSASQLTDLERAIARIDRESEKLVDALVEAPKTAHPKIYARMEALESQKADLETDLAKLRVAVGIRLTEEQVLAWLHSFTTGDPLDPDFRGRIIDTFINSIYLYDDRVVIFYNLRGGKQTSLITPPSSPDLSENEKTRTISGSDSKENGGPSPSESEPKYIFINGIFGCVFPRHESDR